MTNPFYDPKKLIYQRTGEEAYKDYLARMKNEGKKPVTRAKKTKKQAPLTIPSNISNAESYLILPGKIHGSYEYPDLLVSMERFYHSKNWHQAQESLHNEDSFMLTIRQYVDLFNLLKSGKAHDGKGNMVDKTLIDKILDEIVTVRDPYRAEWLDADFKVVNGKLYINYNHFLDSNGKLIPKNSEPLEDCLMKNKTPGIDLDSWLSNATNQGLPSKNTLNGALYYWYPRSDNNSVAGFGAGSYGTDLDCYWDPALSSAGLGVRRAKILRSKK